MSTNLAVLVRHGETFLNRDTTVVGGRSNHARMTSRGFEQARVAGKLLAQLEFPFAKSLFIASPAFRTTRTLETILAVNDVDTDYAIDDRLQEMTQGSADGKPRDQYYNNEETQARIRRELMDFKLVPDGESLNEVSARMMQCLGEHALTHGGVRLYAGHGLAIRCTVGAIQGMGRDQLLATYMPNTGITIIDFSSPKPQVPVFALDPLNPQEEQLEIARTLFSQA